MLKHLAVAGALVLAACSSTGTGNSGTQGHGPLLGAYLRNVPLATFEAGLGRKLDIENNYASIVSIDPGVVTAAKADIAAGTEPMLSLSAWCDRANSIPCKWRDIAAGKYDAQLKAVGQGIAALKAPVLVRPLFEAPTGTPSEQAAGQGETATDYRAAYNHIRAVYIAAGATNAKFVYTPGWGHGKETEYDPGTEDIVAEDIYNKDTTPEAFDAEICQKYGAAFRKPLMISETGAGQAEQAQWLGSMTAACPNLSYFIYWSAPGAQDYTLRTPASFAALRAIAR